MIRRKYNLNMSLAIAVGAVLLVIVLGALQKQYDVFGPVNLAAFQFVKALRSTALTVVMTVISWFGDARGLMTFISVFFWLGYSTEIVTFLLMVVFGSAIGDHMKEFFDLRRPITSEIPAIPKATGYGYPSGHSQSGMYYAWLLYAFIEKYWLLCLIPAIVLAFSRVYLGVHYLSDTIGGLLFGFGMVAGATGIYSHVRDLVSLRDSLRRSPARRAALAAAISAAYLLVAWGQPDCYKYAGFMVGFFFVFPGLGFRWRAKNPLFAVIVSIAGLLVLLALQIGAAMKLPHAAPADFLTYLVQGILLAISPLLFVKIGLLRKLPTAAEEMAKEGEKVEVKESSGVR